MQRIFGHYVPRSLTILALVEFLLVFFAFYIGAELRFKGDELTLNLSKYFHLKALIFALAVFLSMVGVGLYSRLTRDSFTQIWNKLLIGIILSFLVLVALYYVYPNPEIIVGRGVVAISLSVVFFVLLIVRYVFVKIVDTDIMNSRVLIIGCGKSAQQLELLRRKSDWRGVTLIGFLRVRGTEQLVSKDRIIHSDKSLVELVDEYGVDQLVVAVNEQRDSYPVDDIIACKLKGILVTEASDFFERRAGRIQIDTLHPNRFIFIEGFAKDFVKIAVKRVVDVILSLTILILTLPLYPILMLLIKLESSWRDPVFYSQIRVGKGEKNFVIHKFRSMVVDAEKKGAQMASKNDARVTRIGRIMRKTRMDELPQLWNVLKGDMSFVGPRPERPEFVEKLAKTIPYYRMRHRVKPGITGWAQVCYPYGDDEIDAKAKLQFDLYYIKNYSVFLDLTTLAQTVQVLLWQQGAR
jgi:sugar transferase (PEP-CTERM system associated)